MFYVVYPQFWKVCIVFWNFWKITCHMFQSWRQNMTPRRVYCQGKLLQTWSHPHYVQINYKTTRSNLSSSLASWPGHHSPPWGRHSPCSASWLSQSWSAAWLPAPWATLGDCDGGGTDCCFGHQLLHNGCRLLIYVCLFQKIFVGFKCNFTEESILGWQQR